MLKILIINTRKIIIRQSLQKEEIIPEFAKHADQL
jgi:hypothetical protein